MTTAVHPCAPATLAARTGPPPEPRGVDRLPVALAGVAILAFALFLWTGVDLRKAGLFLIGGALGVTLYHAAFGFTGGWRAFIAHRDGRGLRAQLLAFALAMLVFLPLLAEGTVFGRGVGGAVAPVGVSVLIGAFLFGLGMQLGGGCGSGTLFTVGGGNARMVVTLVFFVVGAVVGTLHLPWWLTLPSYGSQSLLKLWGLGPALAAQLAALALIAALTLWLERRHHGGPAPEPAHKLHGAARFLRGPWPILWGAVGLAAFNAATLAVAGHPWSITFAFGLWGAKALSLAGVAVNEWAFWTWPFPSRALAAPLWADTTTVMNVGILLGAMLAAGLAGRFAPRARIPVPSLIAAVLGGLMMGYGARLAFGCNIGALFSGIASGSLHAWLWFAAAFVGSIVGVRLRPLFRLET